MALQPTEKEGGITESAEDAEETMRQVEYSPREEKDGTFCMSDGTIYRRDASGVIRKIGATMQPPELPPALSASDAKTAKAMEHK